MRTVRTTRWLLVITVLGVAAAPSQATIPARFTVQGQLPGFGVGPVDLDVEFYDAADPNGPALGGFCDHHPGVVLSGGVFTIVVGAGVDCTTGAPNLFITPAALTAAGLQIQLYVNGAPYTRERIWSVPFAMGSKTAEGLVIPGTSNPAAVVDGIGNITTTWNISTPQKVIASAFASHSPLIFEAPAGTERARITDDGKVGIATNAPAAPLHVYTSTASPYSYPTVGRFQLERTGLYGTNYAIDLGGSRVEAMNLSTGGGTTLYLNYTSDGDIDLGQGGGDVLMGLRGGNVGIGTSTPAARLNVEAHSDTCDLPITLRVKSDYKSGTQCDTTVSRFLDLKGAQILAVDADNDVYTTLALNPMGGSVSIGGTGTIGSEVLKVSRASVMGGLSPADVPLEEVVISEPDNAWLGLYGANDGSAASGITLAEVEGSAGTIHKWSLYTRTHVSQTDAGNLMFAYTTDANPTLNAEIPLMLKPDGTAVVQVLEITGADVAERFPMSDKVEPGMVVEIDPQHAGQLRLSTAAYNRRVAGAISGAGDLPTGAILGNLHGNAEAPPIALSGRVWIYCDASAGPIEPGDLLTTADRPGHAMKVMDYPRAQGAIIGKAMSSLSQGRGLVLVLVNLQ